MKDFDIRSSLTSRVFRFVVLSFFISNITTILGAVIDGFVVGNTMDTATIAVVGFVSPVVIFFSIIGTTACVGFKNVAMKCLTKGDTEGAGRSLSEALILGLIPSLAVLIVTLMFTPLIVTVLGFDPASPEFLICVKYLRGAAVGLPAITAMAILNNGVQLEGKRMISILSVAVMTVFNIAGDMIGMKYLHVDIFGITLGTSFSYFAGAGVLVWFFLRRSVLIRPVFKGISLAGIHEIRKAGVAAGITNTAYSLSLIAKAQLINYGISSFDAGDVGLQSYNVIVQVNYFVNAFMTSAVSAMFLLAVLFSIEEDKSNFKRIIKNVISYELFTTVVFSFLLAVFAGLVTRFYLGDVGTDVLGATAAALRVFSVGIIFQMVVLVFANYIQLFGHSFIPNVMFFISNILLVLVGESFGAAVTGENNLLTTAGIFGGISAGNILSVLIIPIFIVYIKRRTGCRDHLWMFPRGFGVPEEDELSAYISDLDEVITFSEQAWQFCKDKGVSDRIAFYTELAVEEMASNVITHGFTKDKRENYLNVRVIYKGDELIIRMRDDCPGFDPKEKYEHIYANEDPGKMIGIRMIMAEASEVRYTSMFRLNNLLIRMSDLN